MKLPLFLFLTALPFVHAYDDDDDIEVLISPEYEEEGPVIWIGPGWYYGFWFDDEVEYNHWYHNHYHHDGHHHHHDGHHGGEGHHHGGGGGHHGGGGGHGGGHR